MENKILMQRICKMLAISYALPESEVLAAYEKTNSIDILVKAIRNSINNHTTLQQEITESKK